MILYLLLTGERNEMRRIYWHAYRQQEVGSKHKEEQLLRRVYLKTGEDRPDRGATQEKSTIHYIRLRTT